MKHAISILLLALTLATAIAPAPVAQADAFSDGTQYIPLTSDDKKALLAFVKDAKARLRRVLDEASTLTFEDTRTLYYEVIYDVVKVSFEKNLANQLLMRMVLSQALKATLGLPRIPGVTDGFPGALKGAQNRDVITLLLKQSIELAIRAAEDEEKILDTNGDGILDGPFVEVANTRLFMADRWRRSVISPYFQRRFLYDTLGSWLIMIKRADNTRRSLYAAEVLELEDIVESGKAPSTGYMRKILQRILKLAEPYMPQNTVAVSLDLSEGPVDLKPYKDAFVGSVSFMAGNGCAEPESGWTHQVFWKGHPYCTIQSQGTGYQYGPAGKFADFTFEAMVFFQKELSDSWLGAADCKLNGGYPNLKGADQWLFSSNTDDKEPDFYASFAGETLTLLATPQEGSPAELLLSEPAAISIGEWIHYVITRKDSMLSIFRNGVLVASKSAPYHGPISTHGLGGGWLTRGDCHGGRAMRDGGVGYYAVSNHAVDARQAKALYQETWQSQVEAPLLAK